MSNPPDPVAWAWRKYQLGVPVWEPSLVPSGDTQLRIWRASDHGQLPGIPRWENLEPAFAGFVGAGDTLACAYYLTSIMEMLRKGDVVLRTWHPAIDAVAAVEFVEQCLLGVWFGPATPFILTDSVTFLGENVQNGGVLSGF